MHLLRSLVICRSTFIHQLVPYHMDWMPYKTQQPSTGTGWLYWLLLEVRYGLLMVFLDAILEAHLGERAHLVCATSLLPLRPTRLHDRAAIVAVMLWINRPILRIFFGRAAPLELGYPSSLRADVSERYA